MPDIINSSAMLRLHGSISLKIDEPSVCQEFVNSIPGSKIWIYTISNHSVDPITVNSATIISGLTPGFTQGLTVLPPLPLASGESGNIEVTIDYDGTPDINPCHRIVLSVSYS